MLIDSTTRGHRSFGARFTRAAISNVDDEVLVET
jgi:hypothetical protein